ncbi:MAG: hypothetical protein P8020_09155 [Acidobacteriota bacterium]
MFKRLLMTSLFFCSAAMAQGHTYYIPQFAAGAGGGLSITTTVTIVNLGTEVLNPARAQVSTFGPDGNPMSMLKQVAISGTQAVSSVEREIQGRGTAVVESYSGDGALMSGWAEVTTDDNVAIEVAYRIYSGGQIGTITSILPREALSSATILVNLDAQGQVTSPVASLNPPESSGSAEVSLDVYDQFGNFVDTGTFTLAPGEQTARNWGELVPSLAGVNGFRGSAEITSTVPVLILPLSQEAGFQLTTRDTLDARSSQ